tara:strand:- start:481 stop:918 length:438 start_codon:yes stop_codon:yes gene_type:complete
MSSIAEEFNERLEAFVEKYGLSHASELLKKLTAEPSKNNTITKHRMMSNFLQLEALQTFDISMDEYKTNQSKLSKEARWAVIHLFRNFTQLSFRKIGTLMNITQRAARYAHEKCEELNEVGKFEQAFNDRHIELEEKVVAFIARI